MPPVVSVLRAVREQEAQEGISPGQQAKLTQGFPRENGPEQLGPGLSPAGWATLRLTPASVHLPWVAPVWVFTHLLNTNGLSQSQSCQAIRQGSGQLVIPAPAQPGDTVFISSVRS